MILQLAILFAFLALGEAVTALAGIPVPGSITGMILLTVSLQTRLIRIEWVERGASLLVDNLGFFFIPAGVGVMNCFGLIADQWLPITAACVVSTFIIIAVTGHVHQRVRHTSFNRNTGGI